MPEPAITKPGKDLTEPAASAGHITCRMLDLIERYWPATLMLICYDRCLVLIHTADYDRFVTGSDVVKDSLILQAFPGIKTDGVTP